MKLYCRKIGSRNQGTSFVPLLPLLVKDRALAVGLESAHTQLQHHSGFLLAYANFVLAERFVQMFAKSQFCLVLCRCFFPGYSLHFSLVLLFFLAIGIKLIFISPPLRNCRPQLVFLFPARSRIA